MIKMIRDERIEWPKDVPIGTFDISEHGVKDYPGSTAHILFVCPNGKRCSVLLGPQFVKRPAKGKCNIWAWNGNRDRPSVTPSINCVTTDEDGKPTGGCGWHGFITDGCIK